MVILGGWVFLNSEVPLDVLKSPKEFRGGKHRGVCTGMYRDGTPPSRNTESHSNSSAPKSGLQETDTTNGTVWWSSSSPGVVALLWKKGCPGAVVALPDELSPWTAFIVAGRPPTLETTQRRKDGLFSQLPFKCCLPEVASVGY